MFQQVDTDRVRFKSEESFVFDVVRTDPESGYGCSGKDEGIEDDWRQRHCAAV